MPWAEEKYKSVRPGYGPRATPDSEDPILNCLPPGVPRIMLIPFPMQVIQLPGEVILLFEYDHYIRHVYLDRREHPKELDLTWMGDSIGWWEGNTLVVDTAGLNDKTWLDQVGHPHSDALHVVERIRRVDHDTLQDDLTIDDPKAYKKALDRPASFQAQADLASAGICLYRYRRGRTKIVNRAVRKMRDDQAVQYAEFYDVAKKIRRGANRRDCDDRGGHCPRRVPIPMDRRNQQNRASPPEEFPRDKRPEF